MMKIKTSDSSNAQLPSVNDIFKKVSRIDIYQMGYWNLCKNLRWSL